MGIKAWFMVQVWRLQQIAMVGSLILLVINLGLTVYGYIDWRIRNPYIGIPAVVFLLVTVIWIAAWAWDRRFRLWREQQTVIIERNPYASERLSPKEIVNMEWIWIPAIQHADPETAEKLRQWVATEYRNNPALMNTVATLKRNVLRREP